MKGYWLNEYNDEIMDKLFSIVSDNMVYFVGQSMTSEYNRQAFKKSKMESFKPMVYVVDNDIIIGFVEIYMKDEHLVVSKAEIRQEYVGNSKMHAVFIRTIGECFKHHKFTEVKIFLNSKHEKAKRELLPLMKSYDEGVNTLICYLDLDNKVVKKYLSKKQQKI